MPVILHNELSGWKVRYYTGIDQMQTMTACDIYLRQLLFCCPGSYHDQEELVQTGTTLEVGIMP